MEMSYLAPQVPQGIRVAMLRIADTGTYEQQYFRPYESVVNSNSPGIIGELQNRIMQSNSGVSSTVLTGLTSNLLQPIAQPERPIQIAGGWSENRFRFVMIVEVRRGSSLFYEMVTGWTDHRGISHGGALDPRMAFHVNATITLRSSTYGTPTGNVTSHGVAEASHILAMDEYGGIDSSDQRFRMRPYDVFSTMDRSHIPPHVLANTTDARNLINAQPVKSRRSNGVSTDYLAGLMESYRTSMAQEQYGQTEQQILELARGSSREAPTSGDYFLAAISNIRGMAVGGSSWFSFGDLKQLDPTIDSRTEVVIVGSPMQYQNDGSYHTAGQNTDGWGAATRQTQIAAILTNSVPALMMKYGFARAMVNATNRTVHGMPEVLVPAFEHFSQMVGPSLDFSDQLTAFRSEFEQKVMPEISFNNTEDIAVSIACDLNDETRIDVEWNGEFSIHFVVPSFADAMLSPVVTSTDQRAVKIAQDMQTLFANALGDLPPAVLQDGPTYGGASSYPTNSNPFPGI